MTALADIWRRRLITLGNEAPATVPIDAVRAIVTDLDASEVRWADAVRAARDEKRKLEARITALQDLAESLKDQIYRRDVQWLQAMVDALGMDSGYSVPIVPDQDTFKSLFEAVGKAAIDKARTTLKG